MGRWRFESFQQYKVKVQLMLKADTGGLVETNFSSKDKMLYG